jgi:hypothetical protein
MQEVDTILSKLIESIKAVDSSKDIPYLIKDLDKHVQEAYLQLYRHRELKTMCNPLNDNKRGHCC